MSLIALLAVVLGCVAAAGVLELIDQRRNRRRLHALLRRERIERRLRAIVERAEREKDGRP